MAVETRVAWPSDGYAGFWQRVGGYLVDVLIFTVFLSVVAFGAAAVAAGGGVQDPDAVAETVGTAVNLLGAVAFFIYDTVLTSRQGATLGKRAAGIEVRMPDGTLPSYGRCVGRYFARFLSALPLGLGYLWVAWDERRQTFHDKIVTTVVVRSKATQPAGGSASAWATGPAVGWGGPPQRPQEADGGGWSGGSPAGGGGGGASRWDVGAGGAGGSGVGAGAGAAPSGPREGEIAGRGLTGPTMETARWDTPDRIPPAPEEGQAEEDIAASWGEQGRTGTATGSSGAPHGGAGGPVQGGDLRPDAAPTRPNDPNLVAIERASLPAESRAWLQQVAAQVDPRLDRVRPDWERSPQADAARACAFGILLGHLARLHPHMRDDLGRVAEAHPSFSTLLEGSRLATLEQIAAEPARAGAWLGPLLDVEDRDRIAALLV